jgi:hypothetical protein
MMAIKRKEEQEQEQAKQEEREAPLHSSRVEIKIKASDPHSINENHDEAQLLPRSRQPDDATAAATPEPAVLLATCFGACMAWGDEGFTNAMCYRLFCSCHCMSICLQNRQCSCPLHREVQMKAEAQCADTGKVPRRDMRHIGRKRRCPTRLRWWKGS